MPDDSRPGLAKTRGERVLRIRAVTALHASDARFRAMFDAADAVSEGSAQAAGGPGEAAVWFGSTSLVLPWPAGVDSDGARAFLAALAGADPHVRLRAVRIAHREASHRAPGPLGRVECELRTAASAAGLRIDVDVQAPLTLPSRLGASGTPRLP